MDLIKKRSTIATATAGIDEPVVRQCSSPTQFYNQEERKAAKMKGKTVERKALQQKTRALRNPAQAAEYILMSGLNTLPSSIIMAIVTLFFGLSSYFLQQYVITANAALVVFVVGSYVVFSSYFMFDFYLRKLSSSYRSTDADKRFYVLSNLIKSAVLLSYSPLAAELLYKTMVLDVWPSNQIRIMGTLYCIPDFVSLFLVKKMARSTVIHHCVVCIFNMFSLYNDYSEENVVRAIMIYAVFSTFAYMVNLLLASRFVSTAPYVSRALSALSLLIYVTCCGFNWTWQVTYLSGLLWIKPIQVLFYVALMLMLVYDDVVLMRWLWKNMQRQTQS